MKHLQNNPARLVVRYVDVKNPEMLNDIESKVAYRSNNQNKVDPSDLLIELSALVSLQRYFRRNNFHLERKKGERKLHFGELGITKERLAQVLSAVESSEGVVKAKRKQELFTGSAQRLFSNYDSSEKTKAEAIAWALVDGIFGDSMNEFASEKRRKRALLAQFATLRVFNRVITSADLKNRLLKVIAHWNHSDDDSLEDFLYKSHKAVSSALLRCSAQDKKNEPAFYKAVESVKPAVRSAAWRSRKKVRQYYNDYFG